MHPNYPPQSLPTVIVGESKKEKGISFVACPEDYRNLLKLPGSAEASVRGATATASCKAKSSLVIVVGSTCKWTVLGELTL